MNTVSLRTTVIQIKVSHLNATTQAGSFSLIHQRGELVNHWWRWCSTSVPTNLRGSCPWSSPAEGALHVSSHSIWNHAQSISDRPSNHWLQKEINAFHIHALVRAKGWLWRLPQPPLSQQHVTHAGIVMRISWESPKSHHQISGSNAKLPPLSPLPLSVWWTLVSDGSLSSPYSAGSWAMLSHRPLPRGSHRKSRLPGHRGERNSTAFR